MLSQHEVKCQATQQDLTTSSSSPILLLPRECPAHQEAPARPCSEGAAGQPQSLAVGEAVSQGHAINTY